MTLRFYNFNNCCYCYFRLLKCFENLMCFKILKNSMIRKNQNLKLFRELNFVKQFIIVEKNRYFVNC